MGAFRAGFLSSIFYIIHRLRILFISFMYVTSSYSGRNINLLQFEERPFKDFFLMQNHCCIRYRINTIIRINQNVLASVSFLGNVNCMLLYALSI